MTARTKTFFASDLHLGSPYHDDPRAAEQRFVRWLHSIEPEAKRLIMVGDIFDYWYEYRHVVPRGFTRTIGLLGEMADEGVEIHFFTGNHDIWISDYLPTEIGCTLHREAATMDLEGHRFFIAHGDEYAPSRAYSMTRAIFHSRVCQFLYGLLPAWLTIPFAHRWAQRSRERGLKKSRQLPQLAIGEEYLVRHAEAEALRQGAEAPEFYIFGHRHRLADHPVGYHSRVILLGDWIKYYSYAVWDGTSLSLSRYES